MESIVRGVVQLPPDSEQVTDADEEIFILYSHLQSSPNGTSRGLGHLDSRQDTLSIQFELTPPPASSSDFKKKRGKAPSRIQGKTVDVTLAQDKTALRSRKGDTGSVLWRVTLDFAQWVLQQLYVRDPRGLFDVQRLAGANVLELGAGTGLLSVLLAPHVAHYTATDIEELVPLLKKNAALNAHLSPMDNLTIHPLDWVLLHNTPVHKRALLLPSPPPSTDTPHIDLLLSLDTLYHPALLPPLLTTLHHLATPGRTAALVVAELRAEDVLREFLEGWLALGGWELWRVGSGGGGQLEGPYVMWLGWRVADTTEG